jgi:DNA-binding NtrC family response regulator
MPIHSQEKLLTCLQERKYQPIKGTKTLELTAQVIFTTNANLKEEVEKGTFSEPLRHRIGRYIKILPLRNRPEDILCIIEGLRREGGDGFENMPVFGDGAIALLQEYPWTGNVRQLIRVLERVTQSGDYSLKNIRTIVDEYDDDSPKLGPTPPRIDRDELEQNDDYKNILEFLKDGRPRRKKEIEQVLVNVKSATLMKRLNELIKEGLIKPIGNGPTRTYAATKKIKKQEI